MSQLSLFKGKRFTEVAVLNAQCKYGWKARAVQLETLQHIRVHTCTHTYKCIHTKHTSMCTDTFLAHKNVCVHT